MLIYLDACAIIEAREKATAAGQALANLMIDAFETGTILRTCELSLLEVLVGPLKNIGASDEEASRESQTVHDWYVRNLVPDGRFVKTLPADATVFRQAASLRAAIGSLKPPDAIHIAAASTAGCRIFVTGDERLTRAIQRYRQLSGELELEIVALDAEQLNALAERIKT